MNIIGPHRVIAANVIDPAVDGLFDDGRKARILYTDPPWGDGLVRFFATKARKDTGVQPEVVPFDDLLKRLAELIARHVTDHVFIEMGRQWVDQTLTMMGRVGLRNIEQGELLYASGGKLRPSAILFGSFTGGRAELGRVHGWHGAQVASTAIQPLAVPHGIVFDPFCGMGFTAAAAISNGMEFRGCELNEVRLAKTVRRLEARR